MNLPREHSRPHRDASHATVLARLAVVGVLLISGCAAGGAPVVGQGASPPSSRTSSATAPDTTAIEATSAPAPPETASPETSEAKSPCDVVSPGELVKALGGNAATSTAKVVPSREADWMSQVTCKWSLDETMRQQLHMDSYGDDDVDVEIVISPYTGEYAIGVSGSEWADTDQATLLHDFLQANSRQIGSNAVAKRLTGVPPTIQNGSEVVVAGGSQWLLLNLYVCNYHDCGDAAVKAAKRIALAHGVG